MLMPDPSEDIGPFYKALGAVGFLGALAFILMGRRSGTPLTWQDFAVIGIIALLVLSLIRPRAFDETVKRIATWLPFTKYGSSTSTPPDDTGKP